MMKLLIFAAALSIGGIALAQDTGATQTDSTATAAPDAGTSQPSTDQPSGITTNDGTVPGDGVTQQGTDPNGAAVAPPGTNEPMQAPPGAVVVPNPNQAAAFTPQPATTDYPACSKTVTDHCVQTYERGSKGTARRTRRR